MMIQLEERWVLLVKVFTVPGQVELDPGATPQAQQQVVGTATTTRSHRTNEDEFGNLQIGEPVKVEHTEKQTNNKQSGVRLRFSLAGLAKRRE